MTKPWCCFIGCKNDAKFDIQNRCHPYDTAQSCGEHLVDLCCVGDTFSLIEPQEKGNDFLLLQKENETLKVQVAGLTAGISNFMTKQKSLHKRLSEVEGALSKRKEQNRKDSKQINDLFRDVYKIYEGTIRLVLKEMPPTFEAFKDMWLRENGYKS